jgi:hypothetical protein
VLQTAKLGHGVDGLKRGQLGAYQTLFCAGASDAVSPFETRFRFNDTDTLTLVINGNGASGGGATTAAVFRDPSAWYHIVAYVDMSASGQQTKQEFMSMVFCKQSLIPTLEKRMTHR